MEFVAGSLDVAVSCVRRLDALAAYEFNAALGEDRSFQWSSWRGPDDTVRWLESGAAGASSGDLYARRVIPVPETSGP